MSKWRTARQSWRLWLAAFLLAILAVQSVVRLAVMVPAYGMGRLSPAVHLLTLVVVVGLCGRLALAWRGRRVLQIGLSLAMSTAWFAFTAFDVSALVTGPIWGSPLRLDALADFYCEGRNWPYCLTDYPIVTGPALAAIFVGALVLFVCADALGDLFAWLRARIARMIPGRFRLSFAPVMGAGCAIYAAAWAFAPDFMYVREPVTWFFGTTQFEGGPLELLIQKKPVYHIAPTPSARPLTIVVITVDALRADHVELRPGRASHTPFLQSLAATGKLTDLGPANAICTQSYCGIVAIQSSANWASLQDGPPLMLNDVLTANGYRTHFLLSGPHRTMANMNSLYGPRLTTLLDDLSPDAREMTDDRLEISRLASLLVPDPGKSYVSIHLMSAHPAGLRFDKADPSIFRQPMEIREFSQYPQYYAEGVRQADWVIGKLFEEMERKKLLENAVVVITADHGERLYRSKYTTHTGPPDPDTVRIPLLLYQSRPSRFPSHAIVGQADIAPTLLDLAGIEVPRSWQGQSLLRASTRSVVPADYNGSVGMVALVGGKSVLIRCDVETGTTELMQIPGNALTRDEAGRAMAQAPDLYARLRRRNDAERCFRAGS